MTTWSLSRLFDSLHDDIQGQLEICRKTFGHPGAKGDASEKAWRGLLQAYLPKRYQAEMGHIVDSKGVFSDQIDVVVFDRQYSPFMFNYEGQIIVPAESVYAVFEVKQAVNADHIAYAQKKVASVRRLYRTSLPIPYAKGTYPAKTPIHIYGGLLTFESDWSPPLDKALLQALDSEEDDERLDLGCVAAHGYFSFEQQTGHYQINTGAKSTTAFLFELISLLQQSATVPMIDVQAYAEWL